jgi:hypothetical protein
MHKSKEAKVKLCFSIRLLLSSVFLTPLLIISLIVLQGTPVNIIVGSHVWVEDPTLAWIDGEVVSIKNNEVHVQTSNGKKVPFCSFSCCQHKIYIILYWYFSWHFLMPIDTILKNEGRTFLT